MPPRPSLAMAVRGEKPRAPFDPTPQPELPGNIMRERARLAAHQEQDRPAAERKLAAAQTPTHGLSGLAHNSSKDELDAAFASRIPRLPREPVQPVDMDMKPDSWTEMSMSPLVTRPQPPKESVDYGAKAGYDPVMPSVKPADEFSVFDAINASAGGEVTPLASATPDFGKTVIDDLEAPRTQYRAIPAGADEYGQELVRSGTSDLPAYLFSKDYGPAGGPNPTPVLPRIIDPALSVITSGRVPDSISAEDVGNILVGAGMSRAEVINDLVSRFTNARRDLSSEPVYEWITPTSPDTTYTIDDIEQFYVIHGKPYSSSQLSAETVDLGNGTYRLPGGDDTMTQEEWDKVELAYRAFPDGTVFDYPDGSKPTRNQVERRQVNSKNKFDVAEPRWWWQDVYGNDPFVDEGYDPTRAVLFENPIEGLLSSADVIAGSAPYMAPPPIRYSVAAAQSLPYLYGYDPSTQERTGELLGDLDKLGTGRYVQEDMPWSKRLSGFAQPWIDATVENVSGKAIGGVGKGLAKLSPKFAGTGAHKFLTGNIIGRILDSATMEGLEEVPSVLPGAIARDGLLHLWQDQSWDPETGEKRYTGDLGDRFENAKREFIQSYLAGATAGGQFQALSEGAAPALKRIFPSRYSEANAAIPESKPEIGQE